MSPERVAADLRARVLEAAARTPSPTRAAHRRRILAMAAIGGVATLAFFVAMGGMSRGTRSVEMIAFTVGFGLLAAAIMTRLSSGQRGSMLGRPRPVLLAALVVTAPVLAIVTAGAAMAWPQPAHEHVEGGTHLACGVISVLQGALPLLALLLPKRGTDPLHPAITGAALGMTAGAWTMVMASLRCVHAAAMHGIVAHVVPTLVLTALGAVLGWVLLRVRPSPPPPPR